MKKEFIRGQWYKGEANNHYIKFSHIESKGHYNRVYYTESIYDHQHFFGVDWWANDHFERYALDNPVSRDELIAILPQNHPDGQSQEYQIY